MIPCFHAVCRFSFFFFSVVHFSFFFLCAPACCGEFVRVYSGATKKKKGFYSKECLSLFFFFRFLPCCNFLKRAHLW